MNEEEIVEKIKRYKKIKKEIEMFRDKWNEFSHMDNDFNINSIIDPCRYNILDKINFLRCELCKLRGE